MGSLDDDYPLPTAAYAPPAASMPARAAPSGAALPGSQASTQTPDSIPSFAMSEPMNGHHGPGGGAASQGHGPGVGFGTGLYPGFANGGAQPLIVADTPRSPPEETDLLYSDLPGVNDAPPLPAGPPPAVLPSPFILVPKAMSSAQPATLSGPAAHDVVAQAGQLPGPSSHLACLPGSSTIPCCSGLSCFLCASSSFVSVLTAGIPPFMTPSQKPLSAAANRPPSTQQFRCVLRRSCMKHSGI